MLALVARARALHSAPPIRNCTNRSRPIGRAIDSRATTVDESAAPAAATEMMMPDIAALPSIPGRCATWSGIVSERPRSMNCAITSSTMTGTK